MNSRAHALYRRVPVAAQNLLLSAFAAMLDRERYGGRFAEFRRQLEVTEWQTRDALEASQDERLRSVISHTYDTVPYYRRVFDAIRLKPSDVRGRGDLHKVPLITRRDIKAHFDDLWSTSVPRRQRRTGHTSGTTGTPLSVGYDLPSIWMNYAVLDRHYRWAGVRMGRGGDRIAVIRGNVIVPIEQQRPPFWRTNRTHNQLLLSSFHLSAANLPAYFQELHRFRPVAVDGYPSTLYLLARYLKRRGERFPVRAAISSSETLYDFQRALIQDRFSCPVFDYYALAERVAFAHECASHEGHHFAMEYAATEIVDETGQPLPHGSEGTLAGTTLHNRAMPLLRYLTNDRTLIRAAMCSCGRQLELMDEVATKAEDVLTLKDGRLVSPSVLTHPFKPLDCIEGSQIVQTAHDRIIVRLVPGPGFTEALKTGLVEALQERLGAGVVIDVELVSGLETAANGKFKWVTSHVPLGI